jgi:hypothetical protein
VLPCPEAPLLLLQLLQNSFKSMPMAAAAVEYNMPAAQHAGTWRSSIPLLHGMLMGLREAKGAAVAEAAASALLGPVLQLPNALLHSAAAAGCKGLKEPDEEFCVGCVLTGYHCSTTVQNHLSVASKYCYTLSDAFRTLRPSSGCFCEQH